MISKTIRCINALSLILCIIQYTYAISDVILYDFNINTGGYPASGPTLYYGSLYGTVPYGNDKNVSVEQIDHYL